MLFRSVEAPVVAVQLLGRGAGTDRDGLGEVELVARALAAEHPVAHLEHLRVRDELDRRRDPGEQRARAAGVPAGELVTADRGALRLGRELGLHPIAELGRGEAFDDDAAAVEQRGRDLVGRRVGSEARDPHGSAVPGRAHVVAARRLPDLHVVPLDRRLREGAGGQIGRAHV